VPPVSTTVQDITDGHLVGAPGRWGDPRTDGAPIAGYTCVVNPPDDAVSYFSHVTILLNNEPQAIPQRIGAARSGPGHCFYPIHVDSGDLSGRVHVESGVAGTFTLGQLFEIWKQPLTNTNVAGITGLPIEVYVTDNGTVQKVDEANWSTIELRDRREITIGLGTPVTEIPNYTWTVTP
jgi:hypothetical protein